MDEKMKILKEKEGKWKEITEKVEGKRKEKVKNVASEESNVGAALWKVLTNSSSK